ncbi:MAG: sugar phosphate isomerase/epimerase, partial [Clostridiales bacterium]|nr:sugar phosphate isomerase/epimerase [Clostridiales bacterium]
MLLSTQTADLQNAFGFEEAVRILKEAGFDCYDFSMTRMWREGHPLNRADYKESILALRKYADKIGILCNQSHAPFPSHRPDDVHWNSHIQEWHIRSLEITALLGGKICVIHPYHNWTPEENAERVYRPLLPYCKKYNVKVAVENMWNWPKESPVAVPCACSLPENFSAHLDLLDPEWFVACLDIGHAEMFPDKPSAAELIRVLKD